MGMKIPRQKLQQKQKQKNLKFIDHLQELRIRFIIWFIGFISVSCVGYVLSGSLIKWLVAPLRGPLFYTSPTGALQTVFGVSLLFGFIITLPLLLFQIYKFTEPVFATKPIGNLPIYILISMLLSLSGVIFSYYLVLPLTLEFLAKFEGELLKALISTSDYFDFIFKYLFGFALLFQLPIIVIFLGRLFKFKARTLLKYWRHVIVLSFIVSAILTPTPDPLNQSIMAAPIIILYLISLSALALSRKLF
jgi:sec-independent protein translocase protein TatC